MNPVSEAIGIVGLKPLAEGLGVTYQAVRKWERDRRLPRTEHTGETRYCETIEALTAAKVTRARLLEWSSRSRGIRTAGVTA